MSRIEAAEARAILLGQHADLRRMLSRAREAAPEELPELLAALRAAFDDHNATEEALLEPLLRQDYAWGTMRVDAMRQSSATPTASSAAQPRPSPK